MKMQRTVEKEIRVQTKDLAGDSRPQLSSGEQLDSPVTGIWKYAQDFGVKPSLVVMARRYFIFGIVGAGGSWSIWRRFSSCPTRACCT
jgi:hypothetical protein